MSPFFGPLFTAFILSVSKWNWGFWLLTILTGLCLICIILFVDETYYDRHIPAAERPVPKSKVKRLLGIEQWKSRKQRSTLWQAFIRPWQVFTKPTVFFSLTYYLFTFGWSVGINTTLSIFVAPLYNFGLRQIGTFPLPSFPNLTTDIPTGFFYFTPVVAALLGELVGHWLHDLAGTLYMRRHGGVLEPEARLSVLWISTPIMACGLVLLGFSLERGYHYMLTSLAWGLYVFAIMIITVAVSSYNLDCYPEGSGEVGALVNQSRTLGGFIVSYLQVRWARAQGTEMSFGIQAAVCVFVFGLIVLLQIYGKRLRVWSGRLHFKTN